MARNGENLFRRKGTRFWSFKYKGLDGRWHEQSTGREKKGEAREVRNEELARNRAGQTPNDMKRWTLRQAVEYRLEAQKAKRSKSLRLERTCLNAVLHLFGPDKRLDQITDLDLERYQIQRLGMPKRKGKGPIQGRTVNLEILYLSQILKRANLWSRIAGSYKPLPKAARRVGRAIEQQQFLRLVETALTNPAWLVALCATVLSACATGQRGVEIKRLRLKNIRANATGAWISIPREATKTDAGVREIPLNALAKWAVEQLLARAHEAGATDPEHFLLPKNRSKHTKPDDPNRGKRGFDPTEHQSTWSTAWRSLRVKAGLPDLRFHDMRHLFITQAAEAGVPLQVTQSLVGHMSADMVDYYTHIRSHAKEEAVSAIEHKHKSVLQVLNMRSVSAPRHPGKDQLKERNSSRVSHAVDGETTG